jgi:hypothetical protein
MPLSARAASDLTLTGGICRPAHKIVGGKAIMLKLSLRKISFQIPEKGRIHLLAGIYVTYIGGHTARKKVVVRYKLSVHYLEPNAFPC